MRIVIATGVFPPDIGGPAQYAKNLHDEFKRAGHEVSVICYRTEHRLPIGIRHFFFFFKALVSLLAAEYAIAMDTFSVGVPTILAARLLRKKVVVRISGDFLWESYVERSGNLITLQKFYEKIPALSLKEKLVFLLTKKILSKAHKLVFSTSWQKDIFMSVYAFPKDKAAVIENYFGVHEAGAPFQEKNFVWAVRPLKLKNGRMLYRAFGEAKKRDPSLVLDDGRYPYDILLNRIKSAYAVILPSISDVSPNLIIDAITHGKPFIMTTESGYFEKFKNIGLFVNPFSEEDITEKILTLANPSPYNFYREKVAGYTFTHSYREIVSEYLKLYHTL